MRIVGGTLRGRAIVAPKHEGLRPTADRVRESVFNVLEHGVDDFEIAGARVIDLFAGTGALGLESLSRGAAFCVFVDDAAEARGLIRANVETFGLTGVTRIFRRDATALGPVGNLAPFTLAFLDPPYGKGLGERAVEALVSGGWLREGGVVVLEERKDVDVVLPARCEAIDTRTYGDTQVIVARFR